MVQLIRYWVGGSGVWDDINHWSDRSGGSGGFTVPGFHSPVTVDSNSGFGSGGSISLSINQAMCGSFLSISGCFYSIVPGHFGAPDIQVYGSLELEKNLSFPANAWGSFLYFSLMSIYSGITIKTNGAEIYSLYLNGVNCDLQDDLVVTTDFGLDYATFRANGFNVKAAHFYLVSASTIYMGSGEWEVTGHDTNQGYYWELGGGSASYCWFVDVANIHAETSTIKFTDVSAEPKSFNWNGSASISGKTYYNIWFAGVCSAVATIHGSSTFNEIKIDAGRAVSFEDETMQTVSNLDMVGTVTNPIVLRGTSTAGWAIFCLPKIISCDYLDVDYSIVGGGALYYAGSNSTDGTHNVGWIFEDAGATSNLSLDKQLTKQTFVIEGLKLPVFSLSLDKQLNKQTFVISSKLYRPYKQIFDIRGNSFPPDAPVAEVKTQFNINFYEFGIIIF
jgi:hypothetical protein